MRSSISFHVLFFACLLTISDALRFDAFQLQDKFNDLSDADEALPTWENLPDVPALPSSTSSRYIPIFQAPLGKGSFGEAWLVWDQVERAKRVMKLAKVDKVGYITKESHDKAKLKPDSNVQALQAARGLATDVYTSELITSSCSRLHPGTIMRVVGASFRVSPRYIPVGKPVAGVRVELDITDAAAGPLWTLLEVSGEMTMDVARDRLTPHELGQFWRALLQANECFMAAGLVHHDIKPDNVMVGFSPWGAARFKVIDLGGVMPVGLYQNKPIVHQPLTQTEGYARDDEVKDGGSTGLGYNPDAPYAIDMYASGITMLQMLKGFLTEPEKALEQAQKDKWTKMDGWGTMLRKAVKDDPLLRASPSALLTELGDRFPYVDTEEFPFTEIFARCVFSLVDARYAVQGLHDQANASQTHNLVCITPDEPATLLPCRRSPCGLTQEAFEYTQQNPRGFPLEGQWGPKTTVVSIYHALWHVGREDEAVEIVRSSSARWERAVFNNEPDVLPTRSSRALKGLLGASYEQALIYAARRDQLALVIYLVDVLGTPVTPAVWELRPLAGFAASVRNSGAVGALDSKAPGVVRAIGKAVAPSALWSDAKVEVHLDHFLLTQKGAKAIKIAFKRATISQWTPPSSTSAAGRGRDACFQIQPPGGVETVLCIEAQYSTWFLTATLSELSTLGTQLHISEERLPWLPARLLCKRLYAQDQSSFRKVKQCGYWVMKEFMG